MSVTKDDGSWTLAHCEPGEWVRLETGWWRLGQPLAGGISARPQAGGRERTEDLGMRWPAVLELDEPVLERTAAGDA